MSADLWFIDSGAQHYDLATAHQKWTEFGNFFVRPNGTSQKDGAFVATSAGAGITLDFNATTIRAGVRIKVEPTIGNGGAFSDGFQVIDLVDDATVQISVKVRSDGRLALINGSGQVLQLSTFALHLNVEYYIELEATIDNSAGAALVRVGEITILNFSGDTQTSTNNFATQVFFVGGLPSGIRVAMRDIYIHKTKLVGDIFIGVIKPNGVGALQDFAPVGAASLWEAMDEIPPNITDYGHSATLGHQFSVEMEDVLLTGECEGIQLLISCWKTDSNRRDAKPLLRSAGSNALGPALSVPTNPVYARWCMEFSPFTAAHYTEAEINAIQAGAEITT